MLIKDLRKEDRPLERLREKGAQALSNSELLAVALWRLDNCSVLEKVNEIFKKYSVKNLFEASVSELERLIGDRIRACQIAACFELARRAFSYVEEKPIIKNPEDVYKILAHEMQGLKQEVVKVVLLDAKNKLIKTETVSIGGLNENLVHPRDVFRKAIEANAASIILVHNHPSGDTEPSEEDIKITKVIMKVGRILGIEVKDHVIIGDGFSSIINDK
ncbi:MAG: DNA repair protein RadC [Endomicrobia bacterium]|nr:DNA repair protein RadC [Candidatus Aenigmarchaeota archaeon]MCX7911070.1 DNA repair protein RadC [Endomicrobiia bacterium]